MYERSCFLSGVTRRCRACSSILQRPACVRLLGSRGCSVLPSTSRDHVLLDFWTERLAGSGRLRTKRAPSRRRRGSLSCCRPLGQRLLEKKLLQPEAVEQMQLRGRRRIDGVGRPEFDFYTGLRGTGLRGTLLRALASAARRRRPALRARSSCAPRVVVWPRVSASILTPGSHPTALRRASVTERALYFTAAVQAVGATNRDCGRA